MLNSCNKKYPKKTIKHIIKLSEPDFNNIPFNLSRLEQMIHFYNEKLQTNHIQTLQGMWRGHLKNKKLKINSFKDELNFIKDFVVKSKKKKLIKNFFVFPCTKRFVKVCINTQFIDVFTIYRNKSEKTYDDFIVSCEEANKKCIIIRPLFGVMKLSSSRSPISLIAYALNLKLIIGAIVSISRNNQLNIF